MDYKYSVASDKGFDDAVSSVCEAVAKKGFRVLHVHDVQGTFAEKGIEYPPFKIIEVCNVKYAHRALGADPDVGLMMPCKINVYTQGGVTMLSTLRPTVLASFFPRAGLESLADEVDRILKSIVDEAK